MKINLKLSAMTALKLVCSLYLGCAPQVNSETAVHSTEDQSNIVGGVNATAAFQKENGIVGLIIFKQRIFLVTDENGKPIIIDGKPVGQVMEYTATCTGTLIDRQIVMTAAHCIESRDLDRVAAIAVYFKTNENFVKRADVIFATDIAPHPDYVSEPTLEMTLAQTSTNDIGLIKLKSDAPADVKIAQTQAAGAALVIDATQKVLLSGFGISTPIVNKEQKNPLTGEMEIVEVPEEIPSSGILRKVEDIPVVGLSPDNKEIILNQTNSKGACHGDSGGPAFLKQADGSLVQVGVTSRGTNQLGNCNENAIYTHVGAHAEWITKASNELLNPKPVVVAEAEPAAPVTP